MAPVKWNLINSKKPEDITKSLPDKLKATRNLKEDSKIKTDQKKLRALTICSLNKLFPKSKPKTHHLVHLIWSELQPKCTIS